MQSEGIENFKFEVIDTVDHIDKETLLIKESVYAGVVCGLLPPLDEARQPLGLTCTIPCCFCPK